MITVSKEFNKNSSNEFSSIQEAIDSINDGQAETIYIKNGIYKERVEITKDNITMVGESKDGVIITESFYANMIMPDNSKRGTFRSYTFFVFADNFTARNITFRNDAGFGSFVGQAIAVYAEGNHITFSDCNIIGHQDTLFTGPLPLKEKQPGGFTGPTEHAQRRHVCQLYENCYIEGEVDFIFGSATAYFKNCTLFGLNTGKPVNGYFTAPSTYEDMQYGYVFEKCHFTGNCPPKSFCLGRPWRNYAKTVLINCILDDLIIDEGFDDWGKADSHETVLFAEFNSTGPGANDKKRAAFVSILNETEAAIYTKENVLGKDY